MTREWCFAGQTVHPGEKKQLHLELPTIAEKLPAFLLNGEEEGPTVLIVGGIHGCEYTSIDAALQLGQTLQPSDIKGRVAILPIANPASFYARSIYVHPRDGKNLNRVFPGKEDGTDAERLAYWLTEWGIKQVDALIDLHGGDMIEALVPFTIYQITDDAQLTKQSADLAELFGISYVVGSADQVPGSTYGCAAVLGKQAVIAEAGQQGILSLDDSLLLQQGTRNALKRLGVLAGEVDVRDVKHLALFDWYRSEWRGLWYPAVAVGDTVEKGDYLGQITDEFGQKQEKLFATCSGVVLFLVTSLAINPQDPLLAIGD